MSDLTEVTITTPPTGMLAPEPPVEKKEEDTLPGSDGAPLDESKVEAEEPKKEGDEPPAEEPKTEEDKAAEAAAEEAGIDMAAAEAAFLETGEVPADVYEKATKIGVTKEMVDEFVGFRVKQADIIRDEMLQPFGGQEAVDGMVEWAGKNWTPAQAESFNTAIASGNRGQAELALKALKADFERTQGVKPKLMTSTPPSSNVGGTYGSLQELSKDQADPRYKTDSAYRDSVMAKLRRSAL